MLPTTKKSGKCLDDYSRIENAEESFEGWTGEHPAPVGAKVVFKCKQGFADGSNMHAAICSSNAWGFPESWAATFTEEEGAVLCPPSCENGSDLRVHEGCEGGRTALEFHTLIYRFELRGELEPNSYPECRLTAKGREYTGTQRKTETGKECLRWDSKPYGIPPDFSSADYDEHFPNRDSWSHENFCRNPSGKERPWCFVSDQTIKWEYCDIPMCDDRGELPPLPSRCDHCGGGCLFLFIRNVESGSEKGDVIEGRNQFPHEVTFMRKLNFERKEVASVTECRPGVEGGGREVDDRASERIRVCLPPDPPECKVTQQGGEYMGRRSVTLSGHPCRPWAGSMPRAQLELAFADADAIDERHNFCRNPDGKVAPWCYRENGGNSSWEFCDIPFCKIRNPACLQPPKGVGARYEYPECRLSERGKEYVGTTGQTANGRPCLRWDSQPYGMPWDFFNQTIPYEKHFLGGNPTPHANHCRNPGLHRRRPWCFVSDPHVQWEYCDIPFCHDIKPPECKQTASGGEYAGKRNVTLLGSPCQRWLAAEGQEAWGLLSQFADGLDGGHDYCRGVDGGFGPWCYTGAGGRWEYCYVPFCATREGEQCRVRVGGECVGECRSYVSFLRVVLTCRSYASFLRVVEDNFASTPSQVQLIADEFAEMRIPECKKTENGKEYMGTLNTTASGRPCQPWMSQYPNRHEMADRSEGQFPDDLYPSHNFCRNPDARDGGPWCHNGSGQDPAWEFCDVPKC
ncbi:unnamed protein product [Darwinula stevensoni]|uniref:Kringle domain-containing protein n=1 Tax=Darwinula stevensoni TaxID=69355 RepID=A0A7R9ADT0_9CRUS|nr:unnamed protein product [Darwinula stevensoni]CAG0901403.1 unnamed protein product [Darwinula stevensoni]